MARYVVKNDKGEWVGEGPSDTPCWTTRRSARAWTQNRALASKWSARFGGKVYRVRRRSVKRERRDVVNFIEGLAGRESGAINSMLSEIAVRIHCGEHKVAK